MCCDEHLTVAAVMSWGVGGGQGQVLHSERVLVCCEEWHTIAAVLKFCCFLFLFFGGGG